MTKSINQIDKELRLFAQAHLQINSYNFEDFNIVYNSGVPVVHTALIAMAYTINSAKVYDDVVLTLTVTDKVFPDYSNTKDVRSDTYRVIKNLVDVIYSSPRWNSWSEVKGSSSARYFRNQGADIVDGWTIDITLRVMSTRDLCAIPLTDYDLEVDLSPSCAPAVILINGVFNQNAESGATVDIIIPEPEDSHISNSDDSYEVDLPPGQGLELPDVTITDTDGTPVQWPSVKDFACQQLNALSAEALNDTETGLTEAQRNLVLCRILTKTGQTVSQAPGDDGAAQAGLGDTFFLLPAGNPNPFGNLNRFTDMLGGQSYANDIVIDWITKIMWYRVVFGPAASWGAAQASAIAQTIGGFTWAQPNRKQLMELVNDGQNDTCNYAPFNIPATPYANIWSGTSDPNSPILQAVRINPINGQCVPLSKASGGVYYMICRYFDFADLGL